MSRNVTIIPAIPGKSSFAWMKAKPWPGVIKNWLWYRLALMAPVGANNFFYRRMGIKIGKNVQIMPNQKMDIFFPELVTIEDGVVIGFDCFIACHEFNPTEFRYGPITLGKNVLLGARSFVLPGVTIGENSLVSAQTTIYKDVPANVLAFGSPLQFKELNPTPVPLTQVETKKHVTKEHKK